MRRERKKVTLKFPHPDSDSPNDDDADCSTLADPPGLFFLAGLGVFLAADFEGCFDGGKGRLFAFALGALPPLSSHFFRSFTTSLVAVGAVGEDSGEGVILGEVF